MSGIYSKLGTNLQQIGGECPENWITMLVERPENDMISEEGGAWAYPEPEIPTNCTPVQGLVALYAIKGITEQDILDQIDLIEDPVEKYTVSVSYRKATSWERDSNTVQTMKKLLSLSEVDLNALFTYAVTVQA